jgi:hypothetical protein
MFVLFLPYFVSSCHWLKFIVKSVLLVISLFDIMGISVSLIGLAFQTPYSRGNGF